MLRDFAVPQLDTDNDIWMQDGAPLVLVQMYATSWITLLRCGSAGEEPLIGLHDHRA